MFIRLTKEDEKRIVLLEELEIRTKGCIERQSVFETDFKINANQNLEHNGDFVEIHEDFVVDENDVSFFLENIADNQNSIFTHFCKSIKTRDFLINVFERFLDKEIDNFEELDKRINSFYRKMNWFGK